MKAKATKSRLAGGALALAMGAALAFGGAGAAFADTVGASGTNDVSGSGSADTMVGVIAAGNDQLNVAVPAKVVVAVKGDGTLLAPAASSVKIENNSVMGVHVSEIEAQAQSGFNLMQTSAVAGAASSTANNVGLTVQPGSGTAIELADYATSTAPATAADWSVAQQKDIELTLAGSMSNIDKSLSDTAIDMLSVTWTVAAGSAE